MKNGERGFTLYYVTAKRPTPPKARPMLSVRATPAHFAAIRAFIAAQRVRTSRTAVVLAALEEFLGKEGLWPRSR